MTFVYRKCLMKKKLLNKPYITCMSNYIIQFWQCCICVYMCRDLVFFARSSIDPILYIWACGEYIEDIRSCQLPAQILSACFYIRVTVLYYNIPFETAPNWQPSNKWSILVYFFFSFYLDSNSIEQKNWEHSPFFPQIFGTPCNLIYLL